MRILQISVGHLRDIAEQHGLGLTGQLKPSLQADTVGQAYFSLIYPVAVLLAKSNLAQCNFFHLIQTVQAPAHLEQLQWLRGVWRGRHDREHPHAYFHVAKDQCKSIATGLRVGGNIE